MRNKTISAHCPMRRMKTLLLLSVSFGLVACQSTQGIHFDRIKIDDTIPGGYGVSVADINGDGRLDIIAVANDPAQFVWYQNPLWQKHIISNTSRGNIATAPYDIDDDGDIDLVLVSEFSLTESTSGGLLEWFENPGNPQDVQQWTSHTIDRMPNSHRVQWVDVLGNGRKILLNLPLAGVETQAPEFREGAQLLAYPIPKNLTGRWPRVVIGERYEMAHGLAVSAANADGKEAVLIASYAGIDMLDFAVNDQFVWTSHLGEGHSGVRPTQGSSEVARGMFDRRQPFVASIEPWLGNEVVVYRPNSAGDLPWERTVIDTSLVDGHALQVADLNNDGVDEIVAGNLKPPFSLYTYRYDKESAQWQREILGQGRIAVSGIEVADINGDGRKDIVAIGSSTGNILLFQSAP